MSKAAGHELKLCAPSLLAAALLAAAAAGQGAPDGILLGSELRWRVASRRAKLGSARFAVTEAFVFERARGAYERVRVGLDLARGREHPRWEVAGQLARTRAFRAAPLAASGVLARTLLVELGEGAAQQGVVELRDAVEERRFGLRFWRAERGAYHVVAARVEDGARSFVLLSLDRDVAAAMLRVARQRHAAASWFDVLRSRDAIWRARGPRALDAQDRLAAGFELALRQVRAQLAPSGEVFDLHRARWAPRRREAESLRRREPCAQAEAAWFFARLGFDEQAAAMRRALDPLGRAHLACLERRVCAEAPGEDRASLLPCETGRREPVRTLDDALVPALVGAEAWEAFAPQLRARRVPMLLEPRDERPFAGLFAIGTRLRRMPSQAAAPGALAAEAGALARSQARALLALLRPDGTCALRGRISPGARPGPLLAPSPFATAMLAEMRMRFGDVRGARRALEAIEAARGGRLFATAYLQGAVLRAADTRAAVAFASAVHELRRLEKRSGATLTALPEMPRVVERYASEDPEYLWAIARFAAWSELLMPRTTPRRRAPELRQLKRALEGAELRAEVDKLRAWTAEIEARFEASLR